MNVRAASPARFHWIQERTGCVLSKFARAIEAVDELGRTRGMVAYDGWTPKACQAHMAVESPIVWRALVHPAFQYPFLEAGKDVLLGTIPSHNVRSIRLAKHFGFREAHRVKDGWEKGDDLVLFEMRRDECRFLSGADLHG